MSLDNYISLISATIAFAGLLLVGLQLKESTDQRRLESVLHFYGINRDIISLGFTNPELFQILHGQKADPLVERHYLQLWFNQFALIHSFKNRKVFPVDLCESMERDIRYFMEEGNAQRHWQQNRVYYPAAFQTFIDHLTPSKADVPEGTSASKE